MIQIKQSHSLGHVQFGNLIAKQTTYRAVTAVRAGNEQHFSTLFAENESPEPPLLLVAKAHEVLADDIQSAAFCSPDFHDAVRLHRLLDSIREAAITGTRQKLQ
ncbi:hypothetical protein [Brevibacillus fulvus]|uniref:Uncharacterized protein n=1 Tax=Brevibacillus fulvus TaxID=1125967 RepID=A0A938XS92_9BACL|nr:hypothetical protein [Brevibacillus fulvus]MBM7588997.1 hypothetical protein [Brevibacillus fulvus]